MDLFNKYTCSIQGTIRTACHYCYVYADVYVISFVLKLRGKGKYRKSSETKGRRCGKKRLGPEKLGMEGIKDRRERTGKVGKKGWEKAGKKGWEKAGE